MGLHNSNELAREGSDARRWKVDRFEIAHAAIAALAADGKMSGKDVARAINLYKIDSEKPNPVNV